MGIFVWRAACGWQSWPQPTEGSGSGLASPKVLLIHSLTFPPHVSRLFKIKLQLYVIKEETLFTHQQHLQRVWLRRLRDRQRCRRQRYGTHIHTTVLRLEPTTPLPYEWLQKGEVVEDKDQEKTEVTALRGRWWEAQAWKHSHVHMQIKSGELCQVWLNTTTGTSGDIFISKHRDLVISSKPSPGTESSHRKNIFSHLGTRLSFKISQVFSHEVNIRNLTGSSSFLFIQEINPGVLKHLHFQNPSHVNQQQSLKLKSQIFHTHIFTVSI